MSPRQLTNRRRMTKHRHPRRSGVPGAIRDPAHHTFRMCARCITAQGIPLEIYCFTRTTAWPITRVSRGISSITCWRHASSPEPLPAPSGTNCGLLPARWKHVPNRETRLIYAGLSHERARKGLSFFTSFQAHRSLQRMLRSPELLYAACFSDQLEPRRLIHTAYDYQPAQQTNAWCPCWFQISRLINSPTRHMQVVHYRQGGAITRHAPLFHQYMPVAADTRPRKQQHAHCSGASGNGLAEHRTLQHHQQRPQVEIAETPKVRWSLG